MPLTAETFERLVLEDEGHWELWHGCLVEKPPVTTQHADVIEALVDQLRPQLPRTVYAMRTDRGKLRMALEGGSSYFEPDLFVMPREWAQHRRSLPPALEVVDEPVLLVVEVWSPTTARYDVDTKIPAYRRRGDAVIWRIHPYERTVIAWNRRMDGTYDEATYTGGHVPLGSVPGVSIILEALFE